MPRVLIADDNSNIQKMVSLALKDAGIEVIAVGNGEAAVRKLPEVSIDLVLADIFMPVRSGYEVCEFVKNNPRYMHTPVVLLLGAFDPLDEREVQRVRADGVLKKPFVPPDPLVSMVTSLLAKSAGERHATQPPVEAPMPPKQRGMANSPQPAPEAFAAQFAAALGEDASLEAASQPLQSVSFAEAGQPLAFGSFLERSDTVADEPEAVVTATRDPVLGEPAFWSPAPAAEDHSPEDMTDGHDWDEPVAEHSRPLRVQAVDTDILGDDSDLENADAELEPVENSGPFAHVNGNTTSLESNPAESSIGNGFAHTGSLAATTENDPLPAVEDVISSQSVAVESETNFDGMASREQMIEAVEIANADLTPAVAEDEPPSLWASEQALPAQESAPFEMASAPLPEIELHASPEVASQEIAEPEIAAKESPVVEQADAPAIGQEQEPISLSPPEDIFAPLASETWPIPEPVARALTPVLDDVEETPAPPPSEPEALTSAILLPPSSVQVDGNAPSAPAKTQVDKPPLSPELIDAVVARVMERMQPMMMEMVTHEILRPVVEALVRRELEK